MRTMIEQKVERGMRINDAECRFLLDQDIPYLGKLATIVRRRMHPGNRVSFVVDMNINITNVCAAACDFCAFYADRGSERAFVLSVDEILATIEKLVAQCGTQVMLQGGLNPDLTLDHYVMLLQAIKDRFDVYLHSFSPPEIHHLSAANDLTYREVLKILKDAGLDSLPGGGAEMLVDRVRTAMSPRKITREQWFAVMRAAHAVRLESTATMMFGAVETLDERVEHLRALRDFQDETANFRAFIPWTFSPRNTKLAHVRMAGGGEYLKMLAVSRIYLDNIKNVGSGWVTEGMKVAELGLVCGANDMGGVLMEERVLKTTGLFNATNVAELTDVIKHAGYTPVRRNSRYETLEVYA